MRILLSVEYDGSDFHGWQKQPKLRTVQSELEKALSEIAQHPIEVTCAGRTDKGVHALEQIVHFDTFIERRLEAWIFGTNHFLPRDIKIHTAKTVDEHFHARHSALARTYHYWIDNHPTPSVIYRKQRFWFPRALDVHAMHDAAQHLRGEHDFNAYRAAECQAKHPIREIKKIEVTREKNLILIEITANAFLHHMVRNIVGTLLPIGLKEKPIDWTQEVLTSKQRARGGATAPPEGLFLVKVAY